jgi:hypothetical protein
MTSGYFRFRASFNVVVGAVNGFATDMPTACGRSGRDRTSVTVPANGRFSILTAGKAGILCALILLISPCPLLAVLRFSTLNIFQRTRSYPSAFSCVPAGRKRAMACNGLAMNPAALRDFYLIPMENL